MTSGTGIRYIIDREHGKETREIGKVLTILNTLGIRMNLTPLPAAEQSRWQERRMSVSNDDIRGRLLQDDGGRMVFEYVESWLNKLFPFADIGRILGADIGRGYWLRPTARGQEKRQSFRTPAPEEKFC